MNLTEISQKLPSVAKPDRKLSFKEKLKWTGLILALFFILGSIFVWGVNTNAIARFEFLEIVFGSKFGSLITLGIGPIVTASIILQLLVGSKILNWDTHSEEGKAKFMGAQKILALSFCLIEAVAYVIAGAVPASAPTFIPVVILQLALGGIIITYMDEVVSKWGIGSGISLFIAAGVSKTIFVRVFTPPLGETGGGILATFIAYLGQGQPSSAFISLLPLFATIVVFVIVLYAQSMKIEIPMAFSLPFGKFASRRWPLKFIYTSNIPVILTAAVLANLQVVGKLLSERGYTFLGTYDLSSGQPTSGILYFMTSPSAIGLMIIALAAGIAAVGFAFLSHRLWKKYTLRMMFIGAIIGALVSNITINMFNLPAVATIDIIRSITYLIAMIIGAVIFSIFWVNTSGMDAKSVSSQFETSFLMIPGFRRDPRIIEKILDRYIPALTVLGGAFVGLLAGFADLTNAIGSGTGILLTVMIVYQFYEQIMQEHSEELPAPVKKFIGEE